jgi:hypothetical protein
MHLLIRNNGAAFTTVMTVVHQCRALFGMLGGSLSLSGAMIRDRVMGKRCPTQYIGCAVGLRDVRDGLARRRNAAVRSAAPMCHSLTRNQTCRCHCSVAPMVSAASWRNSGSIRQTTMPLLSHRRIELMHRIRKGQFGLWRLRVQGGTARGIWDAILGV